MTISYVTLKWIKGRLHAWYTQAIIDVCDCDMHQHQATSPSQTVVSSSLGGSVPAAELVTLWRFRNQREDDLRKSVASWNPLRGPGENGSCAPWLITTREHHLSDVAAQAHGHRHGYTHAHTHTHHCHGCSDSVIIPVAGQKTRFYV